MCNGNQRGLGGVSSRRTCGRSLPRCANRPPVRAEPVGVGPSVDPATCLKGAVLEFFEVLACSNERGRGRHPSPHLVCLASRTRDEDRVGLLRTATVSRVVRNSNRRCPPRSQMKVVPLVSEPNCGLSANSPPTRSGSGTEYHSEVSAKLLHGQTRRFQCARIIDLELLPRDAKQYKSVVSL